MEKKYDLFNKIKFYSNKIISKTLEHERASIKYETHGSYFWLNMLDVKYIQLLYTMINNSTENIDKNFYTNLLYPKDIDIACNGPKSITDILIKFKRNTGTDEFKIYMNYILQLFANFTGLNYNDIDGRMMIVSNNYKSKFIVLNIFNIVTTEFLYSLELINITSYLDVEQLTNLQISKTNNIVSFLTIEFELLLSNVDISNENYIGRLHRCILMYYMILNKYLSSYVNCTGITQDQLDALFVIITRIIEHLNIHVNTKQILTFSRIPNIDEYMFTSYLLPSNLVISDNDKQLVSDYVVNFPDINIASLYLVYPNTMFAANNSLNDHYGELDERNYIAIITTIDGSRNISSYSGFGYASLNEYVIKRIFQNTPNENMLTNKMNDISNTTDRMHQHFINMLNHQNPLMKFDYIYLYRAENYVHIPNIGSFENAKIGDIYINPTYISTSFDIETPTGRGHGGFGGKTLFIRIKTDINLPFVYVGSYSEVPNEKEILLKYGSLLKIVDKKYYKHHNQVVLFIDLELLGNVATSDFNAFVDSYRRTFNTLNPVGLFINEIDDNMPINIITDSMIYEPTYPFILFDINDNEDIIHPYEEIRTWFNNIVIDDIPPFSSKKAFTEEYESPPASLTTFCQTNEPDIYVNDDFLNVLSLNVHNFVKICGHDGAVPVRRSLDFFKHFLDNLLLRNNNIHIILLQEVVPMYDVYPTDQASLLSCSFRSLIDYMISKNYNDYQITNTTHNVLPFIDNYYILANCMFFKRDVIQVTSKINYGLIGNRCVQHAVCRYKGIELNVFNTQLESDDSLVNSYNINHPNRNTIKTQLTEINNILLKYSTNQFFIIGGDFNHSTNELFKLGLTTMCKDVCDFDIDKETKTTVINQNKNIDHIFISNYMRRILHKNGFTSIYTIIKSDISNHYPIVTQIRFSNKYINLLNQHVIPHGLFITDPDFDEFSTFFNNSSINNITISIYPALQNNALHRIPVTTDVPYRRGRPIPSTIIKNIRKYGDLNITYTEENNFNSFPFSFKIPLIANQNQIARFTRLLEFLRSKNIKIYFLDTFQLNQASKRIYDSISIGNDLILLNYNIDTIPFKDNFTKVLYTKSDTTSRITTITRGARGTRGRGTRGAPTPIYGGYRDINRTDSLYGGIRRDRQYIEKCNIIINGKDIILKNIASGNNGTVYSSFYKHIPIIVKMSYIYDSNIIYNYETLTTEQNDVWYRSTDDFNDISYPKYVNPMNREFSEIITCKLCNFIVDSNICNSLITNKAIFTTDIELKSKYGFQKIFPQDDNIREDLITSRQTVNRNSVLAYMQVLQRYSTMDITSVISDLHVDYHTTVNNVFNFQLLVASYSLLYYFGLIHIDLDDHNIMINGIPDITGEYDKYIILNPDNIEETFYVPHINSYATIIDFGICTILRGSWFNNMIKDSCLNKSYIVTPIQSMYHLINNEHVRYDVGFRNPTNSYRYTTTDNDINYGNPNNYDNFVNCLYSFFSDPLFAEFRVEHENIINEFRFIRKENIHDAIISRFI